MLRVFLPTSGCGSVSTGALVPVEGAADRLGRCAMRSLECLADVPMVVRSVRALLAARLDSIVVVCPDEEASALRHVFVDFGLADVPVQAGPPMLLPAIRAGLDRVDARADVVVVHEPLRPLAPPEAVERVVAEVRRGAPAVVPVLQVTDTLKRIDGRKMVVDTVNRDAFCVPCTPQAFARGPLTAALAYRRGHVDPDSVDPDSVDRDSVHPDSVDRDSVHPDPVDPGPVDPGPVDPGPVDEVGPVESAGGWTATHLPMVLAAAGYPVATVAAPAEAFLVESADDLLLAEAMLSVHRPPGR